MSEDDRTSVSGPSDHAYERDLIPFHPPGGADAFEALTESAVSGRVSVWRIDGHEVGPAWWVLTGFERPGRPDLPVVPVIARVRHPGTALSDLDGRWHPYTPELLAAVRAQAGVAARLREEEWGRVPAFIAPLTGASSFEETYLAGEPSAWRIETEHGTVVWVLTGDGPRPGRPDLSDGPAWRRVPAPASRRSQWDTQWWRLAVCEAGRSNGWDRDGVREGHRMTLGISFFSRADQWRTSRVVSVSRADWDQVPRFVGDYSYRQHDDDSNQGGEVIATVDEFPSLSFVAPNAEEAVVGLRALVADVIDDLVANGEPVPPPHRDVTW